MLTKSTDSRSKEKALKIRKQTCRQGILPERKQVTAGRKRADEEPSPLGEVSRLRLHWTSTQDLANTPRNFRRPAKFAAYGCIGRARKPGECAEKHSLFGAVCRLRLYSTPVGPGECTEKPSSFGEVYRIRLHLITTLCLTNAPRNLRRLGSVSRLRLAFNFHWA